MMFQHANDALEEVIRLEKVVEQLKERIRILEEGKNESGSQTMDGDLQGANYYYNPGDSD